MSVINQMLRDLDQPQLAGVTAMDSPLQTSWARGTACVSKPVSVRPSRAGNPAWWLGAAALGCLISVAFWSGSFGLTQASASPAPAPPATSTQALPTLPLRGGEGRVTSATEATTLIASPVVELNRADHQSAPLGALFLTMADRLDQVPVLSMPSRRVVARAEAINTPAAPKFMAAEEPSTSQQVVTKRELPPANPVVASRGPGRDEAARSADPIRPVQVAPRVSTTSEVAAPAARREVSGLEIVAQAQRLWRNGSRDAAIGLVADALAVIEKTPGVNLVHGSAELVPMVRELARMELAEGQTRAVLELLKRLEPALLDQPDLWAVRANAAQRLTLHREAVQAYQTALTLRPGEPRWMLGAAVSLAATGQTAAATELAEKARATGAVSPDVVAYLRQLGLVLKD